MVASGDEVGESDEFGSGLARQISSLHGGHAFVKVAGLRFDTGWANMRAATAKKLGIKSGRGPRWRYNRPTAGYAVRHPAGL